MELDFGIDLDLALSAALKAAREGRRVLLDYYGHLSRVRSKNLAGLVSEADVESEKIIRKVLDGSFPQVGFLGEESAYRAGKKKGLKRPAGVQRPTWVVDPLDGTTNYIHQFPAFCISIGLEVNEQVVLGLIDVPVLDQTFHALKGRGAFLADQRIQVSQRSPLSECLLATGFNSQRPKVLEQQIEIFRRVMPKCRGIRRAGAAAYDLAMVALGVFDGFWESYLAPWDTSGGSLLVTEAGGLVTDHKGAPYKTKCHSILAANSHIHGALLRRIQGVPRR